jgi:hypothetical protein
MLSLYFVLKVFCLLEARTLQIGQRTLPLKNLDRGGSVHHLSGIAVSNRQNTASPQYKDDVSLLIKNILSLSGTSNTPTCRGSEFIGNIFTYSEILNCEEV